jgi:hypothetical protein
MRQLSATTARLPAVEDLIGGEVERGRSHEIIKPSGSEVENRSEQDEIRACVVSELPAD